VRYVGNRPTPAEVIDAVVAACERPDVPPDAGLLFDIRGYPPPSTDRVRAIASSLVSSSDRMRGRRLAIVIGDTATYGMTRMFEILVDDAGLLVSQFELLADAEAWLRWSPA
jgi:hypothetical protein